LGRADVAAAPAEADAICAAGFQEAVTWCEPGDCDEVAGQFAGVPGRAWWQDPAAWLNVRRSRSRSSPGAVMPAVAVPAASSPRRARRTARAAPRRGGPAR